MTKDITNKQGEILREVTGILRHNGITGKQGNVMNSIEDILSNSRHREALTGEILDIVLKTKHVSLLTESGIGLNQNFFSEAVGRLSYKLLPPSPDPNELRTVINRLFPKKDDYVWVQAIPDEQWCAFLQSLDWPEHNALPVYIRKEVLNAIQVIAQRAAALGIEPEVVSKLPRIDDLDSPFLGLNRDVTLYVEKMLNRPSYKADDRANDFRQILVMIRQCRDQLEVLNKHKDFFGISLRMTYMIRRLEQYLDRLEKLMKLLETGDENERWLIIVRLFKELVQAENTKYSVRQHFSDNLHVLTYKVVENTSKVGENYIADNKKEYWKLFWRAAGGGLIVAFLCCNKTRIYFQQFPIFWEAFFYSMNYAGGFILIHLLHFTIATKQPAMTASTIAASLSNNGRNPNWLPETTDLLTRLIRSQFISLVGNALIAFPVAYGLDRLYFLLNGHHIANYAKATYMISELNLWQSLALPHAAIAGVYLMISGLISGYYENSWLYNNMTNRLKNHPFLLRALGKNKLGKMADYLEKNIGGLSGNFALGVFLGSTAAVGFTLGLPLDIRHISFSSGSFGIAVSSLENHISTDLWINSILGIAGIGFVNVFVSFGLSILFALNSRNTGFSEVRSLFGNLGWQFFNHSLSFFYPVGEASAPPARDPETEAGTGRKKTQRAVDPE